MKRAFTAMLSVALLLGVATVPATAEPVVCDKKAMKTVLNLSYGVFGTPYVRCQFRLFAPAGRQATVLGNMEWTETEYFHGGVFQWVTPEEAAKLGWDLDDITGWFAQMEHHLYWGDENWPASLVELPLRRGPIIVVTEAQSLEWGHPVGTVLQETYFDFPPQAPGTYKWRYTYEDEALNRQWSTVSHITITPT